MVKSVIKRDGTKFLPEKNAPTGHTGLILSWVLTGMIFWKGQRLECQK